PEHDRMWMGNGPLTRVSIARRGIFSALDLTTNRLKWQRQWVEGCMSGSINTGGGLILAGRSDGRLTAMDKDDGSVLWAFGTDAGVNAPATTFMHEGTQYIAVMSAGTIYSTGAKGDSLWLFSLEGTMDPVTERDNASPLAAMMPVEIAAGEADLAAGERTYRQICTACHGDSGLGAAGHEGVSLSDVSSNLQAIVTAVSRGQNEQMPAFELILTPEQVRDVANFVNQGLFE
ncbi:MAG: quinohemoprotein ethanol dehydrogenase, partial [Pseudohongiellaceae bacterium]